MFDSSYTSRLPVKSSAYRDAVGAASSWHGYYHVHFDASCQELVFEDLSEHHQHEVMRLQRRGQTASEFNTDIREFRLTRKFKNNERNGHKTEVKEVPRAEYNVVERSKDAIVKSKSISSSKTVTHRVLKIKPESKPKKDKFLWNCSSDTIKKSNKFDIDEKNLSSFQEVDRIIPQKSNKIISEMTKLENHRLMAKSAAWLKNRLNASKAGDDAGMTAIGYQTVDGRRQPIADDRQSEMQVDSHCPIHGSRAYRYQYRIDDNDFRVMRT